MLRDAQPPHPEEARPRRAVSKGEAAGLLSMRRYIEEGTMRARMIALSGAALAAALAFVAETGISRAAMPDPNSAPNPYKVEENWAKLPPGRKWGMTIGVSADRDGKTLWTFDRCGKRDCIGSNDNPIQH